MEYPTLGYSERVTDYLETLSSSELLDWRLIPRESTPEYTKRAYLAHHIAHEQWKAARYLDDSAEQAHFSETAKAIQRTIPLSFVVESLRKRAAHATLDKSL